MYRIDDASASATLPTPEAALTEGYWTEGNPGSGIVATLERASWFNMVQEELRAIVVAGGLTPSKTTYNQVLQAIRAMTADGARVSGLIGKNNATTPNTQFDFSALSVTLRNPTTGATAVATNTGTITNNVALAGPVANGRDVAAAFTASQWLHFYFVWNPTTSTLATISSVAAPTAGPALPSGFTAWAYIGGIYYGSGSTLALGNFRGSWWNYQVSTVVVNGGTSTSRVPVALTSSIPPNAVQFKLTVPNLGISSTASGVYGDTLIIEVESGSTAWQCGLQGTAGASAAQYVSGGFSIFANIGQGFNYFHTISAGAGPTCLISINGYSVPNGGE